MDIFERPYYSLTSRSLALLGLWPYQDRKNHLFRVYFMYFVVACFHLIMFLKMCTCNGDLDIIMDVGTVTLVAANVFAKYHTYQVGRYNIRTLLERMLVDWRTWTSNEEIRILEKYAKKGYLYTLAYASCIYFATLLFVLIPFLSPLMDIIMPLNESRPMELPVMAQYFVNQEDHYCLLYLHVTFSMFLGITAFVAADSQFFIFTCHLCSVYSIVGYRLERLSKDESIRIPSPSRRQDTCFKYVTLSIKGHKRAIEFARLLESSFSYSFLVQCGINITALSVSLYRRIPAYWNFICNVNLPLSIVTLQITVLLSLSADVIKYIGFLIGQLFHIFCIAYFGQQIIDHSGDTFSKAYNGPWYERSVQIHKLLLLIMRNSYKPVKLTAGKIFIFSLEGFSTIVQTSTSYFMVLLSVR